MKTIFIAGLHRSGTTILDMILGAHTDCIAVGEVGGVIRAERDRAWVESHYARCTCGQCEFWPAVMDAIDRHGCDKIEERYRMFLKVFAEYFPNKIPVDSSKGLASLQAISLSSNCTVVRIIRDVRGWCISQAGKVTPRLMFRWYRQNKIFERATLNAVQVGYEPLVLDSENVVRRLCRKLSMEFQPAMLKLHSGTEHILVGNRMRTDKTQRIKYDGRWMRDTSVWPILLKPVMDYNRTHVYNQTNFSNSSVF